MNGGGDLSQQPPKPHQQQQQHQHHQQLQQQQWMAMQQYQQQLMAMQMQYPPAVMMNPNMVYGQQYMPAAYYQQHQMYQQQQQQQQQEVKQNYQIQSSGDENRTIWIGDLQQWMDEAYLQSCFAKAGEVLSVKVIRNKLTGQSERYGFIEFNSHAAADTVLQSYSGTPMPNCEQSFRLNWAAFSMGNKRVDAATGSDLSIFVGDLAPDVTDAILQETFASRYPSVRGAKVVIDTNTGRSKGYGFVRFGDETERTRSMTEMNGAYCTSRPMRIGVATPKKPGTQQQYSSQGENGFW